MILSLPEWATDEAAGGVWSMGMSTPEGSRSMPERNPVRPRQDHREAVRLSWKARHIPVGTILIGCLAVASMLSTVFTILAHGPAQVLP